jgi:hypothetical protein
MPLGQGVRLFGMCRNDARMLPYFFRHYDPLVDSYHIYDYASTDDSVGILRAHSRVSLNEIDPRQHTFEKVESLLRNHIWKSYRGEVDWVLIANVDEQLFHPALLDYLARCRSEGITAIRAVAYEMLAEDFPSADARLLDSVTQGCRAPDLDRLCIFDPKAVTDTRFDAGGKHGAPAGTVVLPEAPEVLLLRLRNFGAESTLAALRSTAQPVPGLGDAALPDGATGAAVRSLIERSGLFESEWYAACYADALPADEDPLVDFCQRGWRAGRSPNFYFDASWYVDNYLSAPEHAATNPLVHYITEGEREGAWPSRHFDPEWYRGQESLDEGENALRHFLERRFTGDVSPRPDFDVAAYCMEHPEVVSEGRDPYQHFLEHAHGTLPPGTYPLYTMIENALNIDEGAEPPPTVPWDSLMDVVRLFLERIAVDEQWYVETYPDVAEAVRDGSIASAKEHFLFWGYVEGRFASADD